ncbi:hypothetical protein BBK82_20805 [Lentzea guizhouensis]|uniref:Uncharacterized protein n=1 Tax=Lentzea guizhouensis TaxID=1586287 RepID=A0A1B2HK79_9PSEU|nr:hypothetical protein [Lentzea guizhouensis]ANZ38136.1 hypothetical protein BBK82_20805 [Lentzea guizhouensis]
MTGPAAYDCALCRAKPAWTRHPSAAHHPLCDACAATYTTWPCPGCGNEQFRPPDEEGQPCPQCEPQLIFAALPEANRAEIDRAVAELGAIHAIKRIRDLTGCGLRQAMGIRGNRYLAVRDGTADQNSRNSSGSIPRNAS